MIAAIKKERKKQAERPKAAAIRQELKTLSDAGDGLLTPEAVVKAAKNPKSPLHSQFEWDDSAAAHQHRLWQARVMIASVEIYDPQRYGEKSMPVYVSLMSDRGNAGYRTVDDVISSAELRKQLLATAKGELAAWVKRHHMLTGLVSKVARAAGIPHKKHRNLSKVAR